LKLISSSIVLFSHAIREQDPILYLYIYYKFPLYTFGSLLFSWIFIYEPPEERSPKFALKSLSKKEYFYIIQHTNNIA